MRHQVRVCTESMYRQAARLEAAQIPQEEVDLSASAPAASPTCINSTYSMRTLRSGDGHLTPNFVPLESPVQMPSTLAQTLKCDEPANSRFLHLTRHPYLLGVSNRQTGAKE